MSPPAAQQWEITRKHPRARLMTQVESRTSGATGLGRADNISLGGLLVLSPDTFDARTEVVVRFNLPGGHHIEAQAIVVHAQPGDRMGIEFIHLKDDDRKAIAQFVQQACE